MTPDQWADSDEWPLPTYSGSSKVAATFHAPQDGTQDARKGQGEGSGEIERLRAVVARIEAQNGMLRSALERTEANFRLAINNKPVRDMAETLAENRAALAAEPTPPVAPQAEDGAPCDACGAPNPDGPTGSDGKPWCGDCYAEASR